MRWTAPALLLGIASCTTASPCETKGGTCTRNDLPCSAAQQFAGIDPQCEPDSKCCLPLTVDAGPASPCSARLGGCFSPGTVCGPQRAQIRDVCPKVNDVCCAPDCA